MTQPMVTWAIGNLPEELLAKEATLGFCPVCFAVIPHELEAQHVSAAHPRTDQTDGSGA